jgi:hypothetical protein
MLHLIKADRFPVIKTVEAFRWDGQKRLTHSQIQDLFRIEMLYEDIRHARIGRNMPQ